MKVFFDTSSLFKLYHQEAGSEDVEKIFTQYTITDVFLSELSKVEFLSTVWKKARMQEITEYQATAISKAFEHDFSKYTFIPVDSLLIHQAQNLLMKYGQHGLRSLDSIQLSTAVLLRNQAVFFQSADKLLKSFMNLEALPVEMPVF